MAKVLFALENQSPPSYYRTPGETTPGPVDYLRVHQVLLADLSASDDVYGRLVRFSKQADADFKNIFHPYVLYAFYTN